MPAEDLLFEHCFRKSIQTIKAEPHVHGLESDEYPRGRRDAQHRPLRINRTRSWTVSSSRHRIISPNGATISIAQSFDGDASGAASLISVNVIGTGRLRACFAFVSQ